MATAAERIKEKDIVVPKGWEAVEHKEVDHKLKEEYSIYNWREREFFPFTYWVEKSEVNTETMEYTSGMIAIKKILVTEKLMMAIKKPIKRMDKSSFLNVIKKL